jgi:prevent-host-death family protein
MRTVDIRHAKTHLSRLVEEAAAGEPFVIAKAGRPVVKVVPLDAPWERPVSRIGFLDGQISMPDYFDTIGQTEIERLFGA